MTSSVAKGQVLRPGLSGLSTVSEDAPARERQVSLTSFGEKAISTDGEPYKDSDWLREKYHEEGLTQFEIGALCGCHRATIGYWMEKHGIESRGPGIETGRQLKPYWVTLTMDDTGHEMWQFWDSEAQKKWNYRVHKLAAIAWFGYEAVQGKDIHHVNGVPWDTREENLALLEHGAHSAVTQRRRHGTVRKQPKKTRSKAYPTFFDRDVEGDSIESARIHRLLAVALYGVDAVAGKHVHHKNGIPWDNRPENLELVDPVEHARIHLHDDD